MHTKLSDKEYSRERRRFSKLVIDQYMTLGRSTGYNRHAKEHRRLRDYSEVLFLVVDRPSALGISVQDIEQALKSMNCPNDVHFQQLNYVAELAISALKGEAAEHFKGVNIPCEICGGQYHLVTDLMYQCDKCGHQGRADQHGFPVSLPASPKVRHLRKVFHRKLEELGLWGYTKDDCYSLVAYKTRLPLPLLHAGLITSEHQLELMISACNSIVLHTEPAMA